MLGNPAMTKQSSVSSQSSMRRALVLGIGVTGLSVIEHLRECGVEVRAADTLHGTDNIQRIRREHAAVDVYEGPFVARLLDDVDTVVVSPGVSIDDPIIVEAQRRGIQIVGDVELFARAFNELQKTKVANAVSSVVNFDDQSLHSGIVGITGSNGKSTVTALTGEILKQAKKNVSVGGNIGQPVLTLRRVKQGHCYVFELSSFQLETVSSLQLKAATLLNLSEDHLDRHNSLQRYGEAKARIFDHAQTIVMNRDDDMAKQFIPEHLPIISFGSDAPPSATDFGLRRINSQDTICYGEHALLAASESPLPGRHNALNIMASMALAKVFDVNPQDAIEAVKGFCGLAHRMHKVLCHDGVTWINDSKGTNVGSTLAAVSGLDAPIILIMGGQSKGQNFGPLMKAAKHSVSVLIIFGEDGALIHAAAIEELCTVVVVSDLAEAVSQADRASRPGDVVLFSPACASFDMFANFKARGERFCQLVGEATGQTVSVRPKRSDARAQS